MPGRVAQSVTCLATDSCLTADPGVASSIPVRSHTFVEIDSRRVVVSYKRKYVHELLVNRLFKPAQENVWLGELTVPPDIAVDLGRKATKQTNKTNGYSVDRLGSGAVLMVKDVIVIYNRHKAILILNFVS